jgi:hypothetical protein
MKKKKFINKDSKENFKKLVNAKGGISALLVNNVYVNKSGQIYFKKTFVSIKEQIFTHFLNI